MSWLYHVAAEVTIQIERSCERTKLWPTVYNFSPFNTNGIPSSSINAAI